MRPILQIIGTVVLVGAFLFGCSTPGPVLDLGKQGIAISDSAQSELNDFVTRANRIYGKRLERVKRLGGSLAESSAEFEFENFTARRAGIQDEMELMTLMRELSDYRAKARADAFAAQAQMLKSIEAATPPKVQKEKFTEMGLAFSALSQELTFNQWLTFALEYGQQVHESVEDLKESAKKTEKEADKEAAKPK